MAMRPVSEMDDRTAACFTNLKRAMNDTYIVIDYLENASRLAPNNKVDEEISDPLLMMGIVQDLIREIIADLTN